MRMKRIPADYLERKLDLQFMIVPACTQSYMVARDHRARVSFRATIMKFPASKVCIIATLFKLYSLFPEVLVSKLAANVRKKSRQGIWSANCARKKAELFYRDYAALDRNANASKSPTEVMNVLKRPASFLADS